MKLLLVEDEPKLAPFVGKGFRHEGYELNVAYDGRMGWSLVRQNPYDLVILDVNLPHINGFELCRLIRADYPQLPVLLLTALDSLDDKVTGFEAGADDYLVKPFEFKRLLLGARVLTRRGTGATAVKRVLRLADLERSLDAKTVSRAGQRIELTSKEHALLEYLLRNRNRVISPVDIAEKVWELNFDTNTSIIDVYVSHLRKKLDRGFETKLIHTVVGMGYVLRGGGRKSEASAALMSIRNKLILRFTLLVLGIQLSFSAFVYYFHAAAREQRFGRRLAGKAVMTACLHLRGAATATAADSVGGGGVGGRAFRRRDLLTIEQEQISIYGPGNRLRYVSADTVPREANRCQLVNLTAGRPPRRFTAGPLEAVGLTYEAGGQPYRLFAAGYDRLGRAQLSSLQLILLAGSVGALALIILAGSYFADESLKPIARVVGQVKQFMARELSRRVDEGNGTDEIAQLAITFNQMLSGVEQAFEAQKSFVSHASYELRTPLTTALGTLQTAQAYDQTLPDAQLSMASAVEDLRRLVALTNGLLALALADEATFRRAPMRLDECLTQALAQCPGRYPGRALQLDFGALPAELETPFAVTGNAQLLSTALLNLPDNACKYSQAEVWATLNCPDPATVAVAIADTGIGIGIEAAELARVTEPLYRAENGRYEPGYGIGLAVTQKIAQRHGGALTLELAPGRGTTVTLRLPAGGG